MSGLAGKKCLPCEGGVSRLAGSEVVRLQAEVPNWQVVEEHHLTREFSFADFVSALAFVNQVGDLAEEEAHHPDLYLKYGLVRIDIWTHKIDGLTESDFILAAKIDSALAQG